MHETTFKSSMRAPEDAALVKATRRGHAQTAQDLVNARRREGRTPDRVAHRKYESSFEGIHDDTMRKEFERGNIPTHERGEIAGHLKKQGIYRAPHERDKPRVRLADTFPK